MSTSPPGGVQGAPPIKIDKQPARIAGMFDAIAPSYDRLNHVLSGGIDWWWRRRAVRSLALTGQERVLDLCTGTADLAIATASPRGGAREVIAIDGLRVEYADGFGLARPSNTTPVVVLRFEADDVAALKRIQEDFRRAILAVKRDAQLPF